jgi:hypothetical protein
MADAANEGRGEEVERAEDAIEAGSEPRRPYKAPRLRRLGSVRQLTLGAGSNVCDEFSQSGPFPDGQC